jgi:hypothetical protein
MPSKLSDFLETNKIDPRRLLNASRRIERLRLEDRRLKRQKKAPKEGAAEGEASTPKKPRSGRQVTPRLLTRAKIGKPISGAAKTRIVRVVNYLLEQKKKDPVDIRALF